MKLWQKYNTFDDWLLRHIAGLIGANDNGTR